MITACGLLLISTNSRYSTVLSRIRLMIEEKRRLVEDTADGKPAPEENIRLRSAERQLNSLSIRLRFVRSSILSYTIAIGFFVASSLMIGVGLISGGAVIQYISTAAFLGGMLMVFVGTMFGVLESRKGYHVVQLKLKEAE